MLPRIVRQLASSSGYRGLWGSRARAGVLAGGVVRVPSMQWQARTLDTTARRPFAPPQVQVARVRKVTAADRATAGERGLEETDQTEEDSKADTEIELVFGSWNDPFVVINKPAGIPVSSTRRDCVERRIKRIVGDKRPVLPVHRLDKHTSGLLIVALDPIAASQFQSALQLQSIYGTELLESEIEPYLQRLSPKGEALRGPSWAPEVPLSQRDIRRNELAKTVAPRMPWEKRYRVLVDLPPCVAEKVCKPDEQQHCDSKGPTAQLHPPDFVASTQIVPRTHSESVAFGDFRFARMIDDQFRLRASGAVASYITRRRMLPLIWEGTQLKASAKRLCEVVGLPWPPTSDSGPVSGTNAKLISDGSNETEESEANADDKSLLDSEEDIPLDEFDPENPVLPRWRRPLQEVSEPIKEPYYIPDHKETVWKYLPNYTYRLGAGGFKIPRFRDSIELGTFALSFMGAKDADRDKGVRRVVLNEGTKKERNKRNKLRKRLRGRGGMSVQEASEALVSSEADDQQQQGVTPADEDTAEPLQRPQFQSEYEEDKDFETGRRTIKTSDQKQESLESEPNTQALMVFDRPLLTYNMAQRALRAAHALPLLKGAPVPGEDVSIGVATAQTGPWGWINNRLSDFDRRSALQPPDQPKQQTLDASHILNMRDWRQHRVLMPRVLGNGIDPNEPPLPFLKRQLEYESKHLLQPRLQCGCIIPHDSFRKPIRLLEESDGESREFWLYDRPHPFVAESALFESVPKCHANLQNHIPLDDPTTLNEIVERARLAVTQYKLEKIYPETRRALYSAKLLSGRTHQIRVHFSDNGLPVSGDAYYNYFFIRKWWQRYATLDRLRKEQAGENEEHDKNAADSTEESGPSELGLQAYFLQFPVLVDTPALMCGQETTSAFAKGAEAYRQRVLRKIPQLTSEQVEAAVNSPHATKWIKRKYLRSRNAKFEDISDVEGGVEVDWKKLGECDEAWLDALVGRGEQDDVPSEATLGIYNVRRISVPSARARIWCFKAGSRGQTYLRIVLDPPTSWKLV